MGTVTRPANCHPGISGSSALPSTSNQPRGTYASAAGSSKVGKERPKHGTAPAKIVSMTVATTSSSSLAQSTGDGAAQVAGGRTKAAARRARRKVLEARYAPNLPSPASSDPIDHKHSSAKGPTPSAPLTASTSTSTCSTATISTTSITTIEASTAPGVSLVAKKKKKTRRSGIKARRRIENAQNREVDAVEAALDELDLNGSDDDEESVRGFFRTHKTSPIKTKSIPASAPTISPPRLAAAAALRSPPRATPALRPLRTPFAAHATSASAVTPAPTPLAARRTSTLAPGFASYAASRPTSAAPSLLLGARMAMPTAGGLDPFASRVGLTPRLPSPSPGVAAAVFRAASPIPASPASSAGLRLAWEEGSSYLSNDLSWDAASSSSPSMSVSALREEELDNTRDEIIDLDEGNDTTLDEDEVDELAMLGMEEGWKAPVEVTD